MAHELTLRANGRAEMAFVGETPWHGLGQPVTRGASIEVWQREAGMDWRAFEGTPKVTVFNDGNKDHVIDDIDFSDYKALFRSDTLAPLSIVGRDYKIVQPRAVLEFFREMTEAGGWHIHTAGTLRGGRKLWAMATNGESAFVGSRKAGDEIIQNAVFATSLDGSMKTTVALTSVRVVCANTLAFALQDAEANNREDKPTIIRISHRSIFDPRAVQRTLGVATDSFAVFMKQAEAMAETPIKLDEARDLLTHILNPDQDKKKAKAGGLAWLGDLSQAKAEVEAEDNRVMTGVLDLFQGLGMGAGMKTAKGTRWGLLNAVTQYVDHVQGRTDDTRLDSAFFGRGASLKEQTFKALTVEV